MKTQHFLTILFFIFSANVKAQETIVQYDQLPAEAKSFIKEHFTSPFHHAIKEVERRKISYEAVLDNDTEIEFSEAGRWVEVDGKGKGIPTSFIQKQIVDYIKINHPKESIIKIEVSDTGYELEVSSGTDLKFDARGTFLKIN